MGIFDSFRDAKERRATKRDYEDYIRDEEEAACSSGNYRQTAFKNTLPNRGWYTCPRCGKKFRASGMDVDHIVPQSCGGSNSIDNLQLLCAHCNRSKGADMSDSSRDQARRRSELNQQRKLELEMLNNLSDEDLKL